jgi:hypothetical protein
MLTVLTVRHTEWSVLIFGIHGVGTSFIGRAVREAARDAYSG